MKIFATRVWGLGFERIPIATFGSEGHLNRLLKLAQRGDRLVFVGTKTDRTPPALQGRLLGMGEIGFEPLRTLEIVAHAELDERDFDERGNYKFPHAVALTYIGLTIALPYLVLLYAAFISQWGAPPLASNFTFANFVLTFDPELSTRSGLVNSLILAVSGATLATLLTLIISYMITSGTSWWRNALDFVSAIPLAMPGPVIAVAMLWAYQREPLVLYGTLWILLVAYVTHYLPYGVRTITGSFRQISGDFERAAGVCGASRIAGFRNILFPLVRPGILAGWILMFISMIRELSSSIFLFVPGTETTAVTMIEMWQEARFSGVAVLALTLIVVSVLVLSLVRSLAGAAHSSAPP